MAELELTNVGEVAVKEAGTIKGLVATVAATTSVFIFSAAVAAGARYGNDLMVRYNKRKHASYYEYKEK